AAQVKIDFIKNHKNDLEKIIDVIIHSLKNGGKVLIAGNGGSAADAQHWAAELIGRYKTERIALPGIALTTDTSILTAIGNDYGFDEVFARQVQGLGQKGDIFIGISTSGNSGNIIRAVDMAKSKGVITVGLLGRSGGLLKDIMDYPLIVPSDNTPRIQECHQTIYHTICEYIDESFKNVNL
ncbi:MAG: D-sedoheptulose 7-phosphate isomerase, partial [Candidatus Gracilibacteria bacterium]|nr:D-sedoheptulose 7-phosphate isomerase [Candidatus Gracilibacteria bacterium]